LFDSKMKKKLKQADLFYCATPNMLQHCKKINPAAKWLPNPMDDETFSSEIKPVKLEGSPSVFFPTRFHAFKNPLFGVNLFNKIKKKYPGAKIHLISYGRGADPLLAEFLNKVLDKDSCIIHDLMPRSKLNSYFVSADLVLGQFNENIACCGLIELEAISMGAPLVTLDKYEIMTELKDLEKIAFKLLEDKEFRKSYIEKNKEIVKKNHSIKEIAELHSKNLSMVIAKKKHT